MDKKKYITKIGANAWSESHKKVHGITEEDKGLVNLISKVTKFDSNLLDVGIATGFPYVDLLYSKKKEYKISGIDLVNELIEICNKDYPNVNAKVGDAESIPFIKNSFDTTFCFNSTWYFPDFTKALLEMKRVTKKDGYIIFNMINLGNKNILNNFKKRVFANSKFGKIIRFFENLARRILRKKKKTVIPIFETFLSSSEVIKVIGKLKIQKFYIYACAKKGKLKKINDFKFIDKYPKLIFLLKK